VVATEMTPATGTAEREAAVAMVEPLADGQRVTLGGDKILCRRSRRPGSGWNMAAS
jgi:hypothetical protein